MNEQNATQHAAPTRGPWQMQIVDAGSQSETIHIYSRAGIYMDMIVSVRRYEERPSDEHLANARLIAAAPELLAALRDLEQCAPNGKLRDAARAAIAKAEGR